MTLYDAMFSQYGVSIAQILVTMSDFQVPNPTPYTLDPRS